VVKAFRKHGCFVFESKELERVRDLTVKAEISRLVEIKLVDEKYPHVFILMASRRGLDKECASRVESMLARGEITQLEYKKYRRELIEQCINSMEKEVIKKIITSLENYASKLRGTT